MTQLEFEILMRNSFAASSNSINSKPVSGYPVRVRALTAVPFVCAIFFVLFCCTPAYAQHQTVTGRVTDQRGDSIAGATIQATGAGNASFRTASDNEGRYTLQLAPGSYRIRVEAPGFAARSRELRIDVNSLHGPIDFVLEASALPEVMTVTPARVERRIEDLPTSVTVLDAAQAGNSAAQTLDDLLRQVPGFSIFRRSSSVVANPTTQGVSLRGAGASGASRTLVLTDGLPLNDAFGGWVYWDRVPRAAVERVEVVRGGGSDLYGSDALSGVINVLTRTPSAAVMEAEASYGNRRTVDFNFIAGGSWKRWGAMLTGETYRTDGYFIIAPNQRGATDAPAASRHNLLTLRASRFFGAANESDATHSIYVRGSLFDEDRNNGTLIQRNDTATESVAAGYRGATSDGSTWSIAVFANRQRFHQNFTAVAAGRATETITRLQAVPSQDAGFSINWTRNFSGRHLLVAGTDLRGVRGSSDEEGFAAGRATTFVSAGGRQRRFGFFFQDIVSLTSKLQLSASARYDEWRDSSAYSIEKTLATGVVRPTFFSQRSTDAFSPRIALLYQANESFSLRASGYRAFRAPTLNELYRSFRVGDTITQGNENLMAERLTGGEAGFGWKIAGRGVIRGAYYWTETVNPISNFTLSATPTLITRQRRNLGRTRSRGLELESEWRPARDWQLSAGYLYSDAVVLSAPQDARLKGLWVPQAPRHQFTLQATYSNPGYFTAALQFRASGRQFDDDQNRLALGSFALVDLLASRRIAQGVEIFVAIQNALDEVYAVGRTPIETIGAPRLFRGGVRLKVGR
ncbi:MAG: TonB-dependent receptor [Acidobacteria bacterium]|nr:TonB-dependent receptor [Acidobacteriota bacterium]